MARRLVALVASRLAAAPPRTRALLVAGAVAAALLLSAADVELLAISGRAALVALALAAAAMLLRRRGAAPTEYASVEVAERLHLSREAAVALIRAGGRALLVGYGPDGVRLLADLGASEGITGPGRRSEGATSQALSAGPRPGGEVRP